CSSRSFAHSEDGHIADVNVLDILLENGNARDDFVATVFRCSSAPLAVDVLAVDVGSTLVVDFPVVAAVLALGVGAPAVGAVEPHADALVVAVALALGVDVLVVGAAALALGVDAPALDAPVAAVAFALGVGAPA